VVRHPLVQRIIRAYDRYEAQRAEAEAGGSPAEVETGGPAS